MHRRGYLLGLWFALVLAACAPIQLVADYDEKTLEETIRVGRRVDVFYGKLVELPPEKRRYAPCADDYVEIGADIASLMQRNAARPLNEESQQISRDILAFWRGYQKKHKERDKYPDARLDQLRFERLFTAAVAAEAAKREEGDAHPPTDGGS